MRKLLDEGRAGGYAIPQFNICNLETVQTVLAVADELRSPVILGAHWLEVNYAEPRTLVDMIRNVGRDLELDVAVHLDHGATYKDVMRCINGGFTSVMYDGSAHPIEENVEVTRRVVEAAAPVGITVEAETGTIGDTDEFGQRLEKSNRGDASEAVKLADTGIDCLAVAIGNAHGFYKGPPELDFGLLETIAGLVNIPLVLHGGTGIPREDIQRAITMGISKINFSTALRAAFIGAMRDHLAANPDELGLMDILSAGATKMREPIADCIDLCMSAGHARGEASAPQQAPEVLV